MNITQPVTMNTYQNIKGNKVNLGDPGLNGYTNDYKVFVAYILHYAITYDCF